jgi:hypothetical protein
VLEKIIKFLDKSVDGNAINEPDVEYVRQNPSQLKL